MIAADPAWPALPGSNLKPWENPDIPSGYTYLAQLAMHDILQTVEAVPNDRLVPSSFRNHRVRRLALDTIYGAGPSACPHAYARTESLPRTQLRLGKVRDGGELLDLGRTKPPAEAGEADETKLTDVLIADPRNDDNPVLAQLTAVFHMLHNLLLQKLLAVAPIDDATRPEGRILVRQHFAYAREMVATAFRACIRHDLLAKVLHPEIYKRYSSSLDLIDRQPDGMPLEFSHAASRFGHAMVRPHYQLNERVGSDLLLGSMLWLTSEHMPESFPIHLDYVVDWRRFFSIPASATGGTTLPLNYSARIGPQMQPFEVAAPDGFDGLVERDLLRGAMSGLWSVAALRKEVEVRAPGTTGLSAALSAPDLTRIAMCDTLDRIAKTGSGLGPNDIVTIADDPPLFFFILFEAAEAPDAGKHLGVLGSLLVAEVFFRALLEQESPGLPAAAAQIYAAPNPAYIALANEVSGIRAIPDLFMLIADRAEPRQPVPRFR